MKDKSINENIETQMDDELLEDTEAVPVLDDEEAELTEEIEELIARDENSGEEVLESIDEVMFDADGTELESFESADVEEKEFVEEDRIMSIVESILFSTDRPQSLSVIKQAFKGTQVKTRDIRKAIEKLSIEYAGACRGISIEEVNSGYQLRTKVDNMSYMRSMVKGRPFKLSGPALEVLSILAYKQPCTKSEVDEIRGVESGHLVRGLMEKNLLSFAGKSDLPGKPMLYQTTRRFLEIFGLRNIRELPSLTEIDELIPEGIGEEEEKEEKIGDLTEDLSQEAGASYSEGEEELGKITDQLSQITTSSEFFDEEKRRQKERREKEKAQNIREAIEVGEEVEDKDRRWLERWEAKQSELNQQIEDSKTVEAQSDENSVAVIDIEEQKTEVTESNETQNDLDIALEDPSVNSLEEEIKTADESADHVLMPEENEKSGIQKFIDESQEAMAALEAWDDEVNSENESEEKIVPSEGDDSTSPPETNV